MEGRGRGGGAAWLRKVRRSATPWRDGALSVLVTDGPPEAPRQECAEDSPPASGPRAPSCRASTAPAPAPAMAPRQVPAQPRGASAADDARGRLVLPSLELPPIPSIRRTWPPPRRTTRHPAPGHLCRATILVCYTLFASGRVCSKVKVVIVHITN